MRTFSRLAYGAIGVGVATLGGVALATAGLAFLIGTPRRIFNPRKSPARRGAACEDVTLTPRGGGPRLAAGRCRPPAHNGQSSSPTARMPAGPLSSSGASRSSPDGCRRAVFRC